MGSPYFMPKDAGEEERLDAQHALMRLAFGGSYLAPVLPRRILDIGCGTGIWARHLAQLFPQATVTGMDADKTSIDTLIAQRHPARLRWVHGDALDAWPFEAASFDYVHVRFGGTWIPERKWPFVLSEAARVLRPGGFLEQMEGSLPTSANPHYQQLALQLGHLAITRGLDFEAASHLAERQRAAGFVNVQERRVETGQTPEQQQLLLQTTVVGFRALLPVLKKHLSPLNYAAYESALVAVEKTSPIVRRLDVAAWGQKPALKGD